MMITEMEMEYYDVNNDGTISLEDNIDPAHFELMTAECDFNGNGVIEVEEVH